MLEFLVLSLPTAVYLVVRRRAPDAVSVMGLRAGSSGDYAWAAVIAAGLATVSWAVLTWGIDVDVHGAGMTGRITGVVSGVAVVLRAAGEEVFFRGFVTGLLARRLVSILGNLVQAVVFLLPHLLLLLVDVRLWPILPVQAVAGWLMGWLRLRHGSVLPAIGVHSVLNLVATLG
ncbi:MAG: CPBP family intramembrane metalloprotease [Microlunatus sp.]|nr:CPBP family intramembrane metalloprotease [Microlunatus sp.]